MKIPNFLDNVNIGNVTIPRVQTTKFLRVILDENLNWEEQIENLSKSLIKTCISFEIIKNHVHSGNRTILYYAYIYSKIQYGIEVYRRANKTALNKVLTQQNRSLKILHNKDCFTPTIQLHRDLNLLLVRDIYKLCIPKFVYKHQTDTLPEIFNNIFTVNNEIHNHNIRQRGNLHIDHKMKKLENLTRHQGTEIWNATPTNIQECKTIKSLVENSENLLFNHTANCDMTKP